MNTFKFKEDVQLLYDLQKLIENTEETARLSAHSPGIEELIPMAGVRARDELDILYRAKAWLEELIGIIYGAPPESDE